MPIYNQIFYSHHPSDSSGLKDVILIHGAGGNYLYWPPEIRRMAGYHVIALDLPGHGKSGRIGFQTIPDYAQEVAEWIAAIGLNKAILVGHSMGAAVALAIAFQFPQMVMALGLVGCGNKLSVSPWLLETTASPVTFHSAVEKIIQWSFYSGTPERLKTAAAKRILEIRPSVLHADFLACNTFETSDRLQSIRCPTLVIYGQEDKMIPFERARLLAASVPNARWVAIPQAGHMVILERPQEVFEKLKEFLDAISD